MEFTLKQLGWHGPNRCVLYGEWEETISHIFLNYHFTLEFWDLSNRLQKFNLSQQGTSFEEALHKWPGKSFLEDARLSLEIAWSIWITRNDSIFNNQLANPYKANYKLKVTRSWVHHGLVSSPRYAPWPPTYIALSPRDISMVHLWETRQIVTLDAGQNC